MLGWSHVILGSNNCQVVTAMGEGWFGRNIPFVWSKQGNDDWCGAGVVRLRRQD